MLVHQLPPEPPALRVRVWRRLHALGAMQLKNSVYLLPEDESTLEDFEWLVEEIRSGGGEATLWRSGVVEGSSDAELIDKFHETIEREYEALEDDVRALDDAALRSVEGARACARLMTRFREISAHDHFGAPRREVVGAVLDALQHKMETPVAAGAPVGEVTSVEPFSGRIWVTRADVKIDRITSAWLIWRFIDPQARFAFTRDKQYAGAPGELRFDMYGGEYTHEGDACTFEVLLRRFGLTDAGLVRLGEIVHDVDLKDSRYNHPETSGVAAVLAGLTRSVADDSARIAAATPMLDGLLDQLRAAAQPG